ncbi:MAG: ATP-dependent Clp protease ATP-binding subunit [Oligoflexia bacterium]|nr:ATP-dependent Clp protease ATP-binding subunit [Oligoflexia bacterium]
MIAPTAVVPPSFTLKTPLTIASYANSDSRKLIDEFVAISLKQALTPILWTHSEGLKIIGESYSSQYIFNDELFTRVFLSPFDVLKHIKNARKQNVSYILEDFHYYLSRDNLSGAEFTEFISLIKSMQSDLKSCNSFLTILAPHLDLPPEIAPIFETIKNSSGKKKFHYLDKYGTDLTKLVLEQKIRPIVGREAEITECLKIISKLETNNPLLVGQSGVGKTAIVEGLAATLINNKISPLWSQKRIISLNLNLMISGTKYRGEFENRLEGLLDEVKDNDKNIIIFIDEIHTLLGMGRTEGSMGAENVLKPALARGEFPCIGATTSEEHDNYIRPDKALSRRFQIVQVSEPDTEYTLKILRGIKNIYEGHHQVEISEQALIKCVEISAQLLKGQYFPGKAIKVMDNACASASIIGQKVVTPEFVISEFTKKM